MTEERLWQVARKMHLYIFLHSENEQEVYNELGLTEQENRILGYSGEIKLKSVAMTEKELKEMKEKK